jgi:hypothetical protein
MNPPANLAHPRWTHQFDDSSEDFDGRHFSEVIDFMARRDVNIDSDHMFVVIKLRARICRASNTEPQQLRRFAVDGLKDRDFTSRYYDELESELFTTKLG